MTCNIHFNRSHSYLWYPVTNPKTGTKRQGGGVCERTFPNLPHPLFLLSARWGDL